MAKPRGTRLLNRTLRYSPAEHFIITQAIKRLELRDGINISFNTFCIDSTLATAKKINSTVRLQDFNPPEPKKTATEER